MAAESPSRMRSVWPINSTNTKAKIAAARGEDGALAAIRLGGQQRAGAAHQVGGRLRSRQRGEAGGERGVVVEFGGAGGALARVFPHQAFFAGSNRPAALSASNSRTDS